MRHVIPFALLASSLVAAAAPASSSHAPEANYPAVEWSSILGPGAPLDIALDAAGATYIVGAADRGPLPATTQIGEGNPSSFLAKIDPSGADLVFLTAFAQRVTLRALAVTPEGVPFVAGTRDGEAVVMEIAPDGAEVLRTTSIGPGFPADLALDQQGNAYVTGWTGEALDFPATKRFLPDLTGALTASGAVVSPDRGVTWQAFGEGLPDEGRVFQIAADQQIPGLYYAATQRGLFRRTPGATAWEPSLQFHVGVPWVDLVIVSPTQPGVVYSGQFGDLYRSDDRGVTWRELHRRGLPRFSDIVADPATPDKLYFASDSGVYVSLDGGQTWTPTGLTARVERLVVHPADAQILYADRDYPDGLWKSVDGGATWEPFAGGTLCISPSAVETLYVFGRESETTLERSDDGGATWRTIGEGLPPDPRGCNVSPHDPDLLFAWTNQALYRSVDGGETWTPPSPDLRLIAAGLVTFDPFDPDRILRPVISGLVDRPPSDVFITKLDSQGERVYSVIAGGSDTDSPNSLAVRPNGAVVVAGNTSSADFPIVDALQGHKAPGASPAFVLELDPSGERITRSTFWGGSRYELVGGVALGPDGHVFLAGQSDSVDFPLANAMQPEPAGAPAEGDSFITKFDFELGRVEYSTFLGGSGYESVTDITVDAQDRLHLVGRTDATDFPSTARPLVPCVSDPLASGANSFVLRLAADGGSIERSLIFGGGADDVATAAVLRSPSVVTVSGYTESVDFITGPRGYLGSRAGRDVFVSAFDLDRPNPAPSPAIDCVTSAASFRSSPVSPGEIVSLFGVGIGPADSVAFTLDSEGRAPRTLAGTQVLFDGSPAPLLYVSATQINAIAPLAIGGASSTSIEVVHRGARTAPAIRGVRPASPALFTHPETGLLAALNQDGTPHSYAAPVSTGSIISVFLTGLGTPESPLPDGAVNPLAPSPAALDVQADFEGVPAEIVFIGPAPGLLQGVWQLNVRIPEAAGGQSLAYLRVSLNNIQSEPAPIALTR